MKVLVSAASKHGATTGIADAIGSDLEAAGLDVTITEPGAVATVDEYDAVVLGSAVYAGRWLGDARAFVDQFEPALRERSVWLFSSGPIGEEHEPNAPAEVAAIAARIGALEHRVFAGSLDRARLGLVERAVTAVVRAPDGDFRDWPEIRAWATSIRRTLVPTMPAVIA